MSSLAAPPEDFRPADHPRIVPGETGVLLVNLGTPEGTSYWPMRRYLKEFLSDRRVIELNPILWQVILNAVILATRPSRSGKAYEKIWNRERNESPLLTFTRGQAEGLGERLGGEATVDWAMRYGAPSIGDRLKALADAGCRRILIFALYPQYSAATNATVYDKAFDALKQMRWQPAIRTVAAYHDDPAYIDALARSVETHLAGLDWEPEMVLASFHGLPKDYLLKGDPYHCHCVKTARLLRERLGWDERRLQLTFQSRFGRQEWLQPYTDKTLKSLAESGVRRVALIMPGFVADCVETLEEIGIAGRDLFLQAGGEYFTRIPCLNDSPGGLDVIEQVVRRELSGWVEP